jgi:hypothetical protein
MKTVAKDCESGKDDWAYVGLLSTRHELNQQAAFAGDIAVSKAVMDMR